MAGSDDSGNSGSSKTRTMLGFTLDFKSNAKKAFKNTTKFVVDFMASWGKANKTFSQRMRSFNVHLRDSIKSAKEWARTMKDSGPTITDVIDQIGEKFGGVAGIIADTLARPGALMAGTAAVATRAGMDMESAMVSLRRETALTEEEWDKYRSVILAVSESMHAPMSQVQGLAKAFGAANLDIAKYPQLMEAAISVNRLTGIETHEVGNQIMRMARDLKMGASEIHDYFNEAYAAAQISNADLSSIFGSVDEITYLVSRYMPDNMKKGMTELTKVFATSADMFEGNKELMHKIMAGIMDVSSPEFAQIRSMAAAAGGNILSEFEDAVANGDISHAFKKLVEGAKGLSFDNRQLQQLGGVLGFDAKTIRQLRDIDTSMLAVMDSAAESSKSSNKMLHDTKNLVTTTERWHKVWADIERVLLPLGEVIVELLHPIFAAIGAVATWVAKFTSSLGPLGKRIMAIGIALATWKMWFTPVITLLKIFGARLLGGLFSITKITTVLGVAAKTTGGLVAGTGSWVANLFRGRVAAGGVSKSLLAAKASMTALNMSGVGFSGTLKDVFKSSGALLMRIGKLALPFTLAYAAVTALDGAFKKAFNFSFLDKISDSLGISKEIIAGVLAYLLMSKRVLGLFSPLTKLFTAALTGSWTAAKGLWGAFASLPGLIGKSTVKAKGLAAASVASMKSLPGALATGFKSFGGLLARAGGSILRLAGPIGIIVGVLTLVDKVMKKTFGIGIIQAFGKAIKWLSGVLESVFVPLLDGISWLIEQVASGWSSIIDGAVWLFTNDKEWEEYKKKGQKGKTTSLIEDVGGMFGESEASKVATEEAEADSLAAYSPIAESMTDPVTGRTVSPRESFGTDDIISAIFKTNAEIAELLRKIAYDPIAGVQGGVTRHDPIRQRSGA